MYAGHFIKIVSIMLVCSLTIIGCSKNDKNPVDNERKKSAWVSGQIDSTGYGMILYSKDGGDTWVRQGMGLSALNDIHIWNIWAVDDNNVWAIGAENTILKTSDGGKTWPKIQTPVNTANPGLQSLSVVDKTNIWISGDNGTVYNSNNNGNTWTMFDNDFFHKGLMQGICAITPEKVYVVGQLSNGNKRGFIGFTLDGGISWDSVSPANNFNKYKWLGIKSYGDAIVIYGEASRYMFSNDGGTTWKNDSIPTTGNVLGRADFNDLTMINSQTWWGAFDQNQIYITTDSGENWNLQQTNQAGYFMMGIDAWDSQLALSVTSPVSAPFQSPIVKTTDGGLTWKTTHTSKTFLTHISFIKE